MNTNHRQYSKCRHHHLQMCGGVEKVEAVEGGGGGGGCAPNKNLPLCIYSK